MKDNIVDIHLKEIINEIIEVSESNGINKCIPAYLTEIEERCFIKQIKKLFEKNE